jgi:hypothetical protein
MRTAITTATVGGKTVLVTGREVPADKQRSSFNVISPAGATEVQLWVTGANLKTRKLIGEKPKAEKK